MRVKILAMALAAAGLSSCMVVSINPLFTEEDLIFDEQLVGTWAGDDNRIIVEKGEQGSYRMTYIDEDERTDYRLSLLRLGNRLFWDMEPWEALTDDDFLLLQTHLAVRVSPGKDTLTMSILDGDWLRKRIKDGAIQVKHQLFKDRVVLTGSTPELQAFIRSIAEDDEAFPEPEVYRRVQ